MASIVIGGGNTNLGLRFLEEKDRAFRRDAAREQAAREQERLALANAQFGQSIENSNREFGLRQQEFAAKQEALEQQSERASSADELARMKFEETQRRNQALEQGAQADRQRLASRDAVSDERFETTEQRLQRQAEEDRRRFGITDSRAQERLGMEKDRFSLLKDDSAFNRERALKDDERRVTDKKERDKKDDTNQRLGSIGRDRSTIERRLESAQRSLQSAKASGDTEAVKEAMANIASLDAVSKRLMGEETNLLNREPLELPKTGDEQVALDATEKRKQELDKRRKSDVLKFIRETEAPNLSDMTLEQAEDKIDQLAQENDLEPGDLKHIASEFNLSIKETSNLIRQAKRHPVREKGINGIFQYMKRTGSIGDTPEMVNIHNGRPAKPGDEVKDAKGRKHTVSESDIMTFAEYAGMKGIDVKGVTGELKEFLAAEAEKGGLDLETNLLIEKILSGQKVAVPDDRSEKELAKHAQKLFSKTTAERRNEVNKELVGETAAPFATAFRGVVGAVAPHVARAATAPLNLFVGSAVYDKVKAFANRGDIETAEMVTQKLVKEGYSEEKAAEIVAAELKRRK